MASSTALRISDDWARHVSYTERQTFQMEHPHDYGSQSAWRTTGADAGPSYSHFANYSHLTAAYRPPSQTSPNDYRTPEPAYSQHEQMYPSQPSYAPDPRYIPVAPSTPQTSSHMQQAHDLRQAPVTPLYPSSPYSHSSAPGYATGISPSSSILPPSAASYHNVPHTAVQDHNTDTVTYSPVDPVPLSAPIAQAGPTVDYEQVCDEMEFRLATLLRQLSLTMLLQMLRSYERLLVDLPSADEWSNENARQAMSSASLGGLVSAAVTGLQTLDPNARFESVSPPPENTSELHSVSPSLSSAYQMPIIRTKRVSCHFLFQIDPLPFCLIKPNRPRSWFHRDALYKSV